VIHSGEGFGFGFRLLTGRSPSAQELAILDRAYARHLATYRASPDEARNLLAHGDSPRDAKIDVAVFAANTMVASMMLNLDEGITRE